jgi:hypothetical protein
MTTDAGVLLLQITHAIYDLRELRQRHESIKADLARAENELETNIENLKNLYAQAVQYGRHAHAGVWISDEDADRIAKDGP